MSKHDFKSALEWADYELTHEVKRLDLRKGYVQRYIERIEVIQTALRIADRLQSGEVDLTDIQMPLPNIYGEFQSYEKHDLFEAMANQLIKECEND